MKRRTTAMFFAAAIGACAMIVAATAAQRDEEPGAVRGRNNPADRAQAGQFDDKTTGFNIRASQLTGLNIVNPQGKDVGEVEDLVINAGTGRV